ncbi:signal peptidase I [Anaerolentibacter hominis]|uniref:signal peptidase I n=1 Tax=Anaerolentibacter hominis TaxID=3079009 RepID=UPI0031B83D4C
MGRERLARLKRLVEEERRELGKRRRRRRRAVVLAGAAAVLAVLYVLTLGIGIRMVWGDSMYPSYQEGDVIVYRRGREIEVGEVAVIETGYGKLLKRVAGKSGDKIEIEEGSGKVRRNEVTQEEKYAVGKEKSESSIEYPYEVGEGEVFVLGDNRESSLDSRSREFGVIKEEQIKGKVVYVWRRVRKRME